MKRGLTVTQIFLGRDLNYGESPGAVHELKKITRGNGDLYSYISRQSLIYDICRIGEEVFDWNLDIVSKNKNVIQFSKDSTIADSPRLDLFGYMKTFKGNESDTGGSNTRKACVRITDAISLEPYKGDTDYLTNKGLADRINEFPTIVTSEKHSSFYTFTYMIDLNRVGIDGNIELDNNEKANRVNQLLEIIKLLNRNIGGKTANLTPVFAIGGIYNICNPFFLDRIKLNSDIDGYSIDTKPISSALDMDILDEEVKVRDCTNIGIVEGTFKNESQLEDILKTENSNKNLLSIGEFYKNLKKEIKEFYKVQ